jgi:hypothetical protein
MKSSKEKAPISEKDRLETRPSGALPTPLDPAGPQARGYPADLKVEERIPAEVDEKIDRKASR